MSFSPRILLLIFLLIGNLAYGQIPITFPDAATTNEDTQVTLSILNNDIDITGLNPSTIDLDPGQGGQQLTYTDTGKGTYTVDGGSGVVTFVPDLNFFGQSNAQYSVTNGLGITSGATNITVNVTSVNDLPQATADVAVTNEDINAVVDVTANDSDADGTIDDATVDLNPTTPARDVSVSTTEGVFTVDNSGNVTFDPADNYNGPASITYNVKDNSGGTSNTATLSITVNAVNDPPVAVADATSTNEGTLVTLNILANDTDVESGIDPSTVDLNPLTPAVDNMRTTDDGTWSVDGSGVVSFTPAAGFVGPTMLNYTVKDAGGAESNQATITITVNNVNDPPTAAHDAVTADEDNNAVVNVVSNDTDTDGTINAATVDLDVTTPARETSIAVEDGTFSVTNAGVVTFQPDPNFHGTVIHQYNVKDNSGATSNNATITVTITDINDAPVAVADAATTSENTPVSLNVLTNDSDVDGTLNAATVDLDVTTAVRETTRTVTGGTFTVDNAGVVTFTPNAGYDGPATVNYLVKDDDGASSNSVAINITVTGSNDPPDAVADATTTSEDVPVTINVVANDTDPDGTIDAATVDLDVSTPARETTVTNGTGTFTVSNAGVVTYTPASDYNGTATLQYTVKDNDGAVSDPATITITVSPVNDPPKAVADVATTAEDTPVTVNVVSNDTDVDGTVNAATVDLDPSTPGTQTSVSPTGGTFTVSNAGIVTFTPTQNYSGGSTASYTVNDNNGAVSNSTTITITVTAVNDPPQAQNDVATTPEDTPVSINVLTNDSDIDGTLTPGTLDLDVTTAGVQNTITIGAGTFTITSPGIVTFTPALDYSGPAAISYTVNDNGGATSNQATITVTVTASNDAPKAVSDAASTNEDTSVTLNVISNDSDDDGSINPATVDLNPTSPAIDNSYSIDQGTFTVNNSGVVTFTPALNYFGPAAINYTVNDNDGARSNQAQINITVNSVNDAPEAVNDATSTNESVAVNLNVVTNDKDVDGTIAAGTVDLDMSTAGIQSTFTTLDGTFTVNSSGVVNFVPLPVFNGVATTRYTVQDNNGATSNQATISITVNAVNDPPVAVDDVATTNEDVAVTVNVVANDTDEDGSVNPATVDLNTAVAGIQNTNTTGAGTFSVNTSGVVTYTPIANFNGPATIAYRVNDDAGATSNSATITITVNALNDPPVAVNDAVTTNEDVAVTLNVVTNDTDIDGSINPATVDLNPSVAGIQTTVTISGGTVSVSLTGVVTFTPTVNFYGITTCPYTVNDNSGATSNSATITFTVNAVNDPPIANNDITSADENETVTLNVVANDIDIDGTINVATVDLNPSSPGRQTSRNVTGGTFTVSDLGVVTFTPNLNFNGIATVTYSVQDDGGTASNAATITVTVNSVNSDPVANNDATTTNEDVAVSFNVVSNDTDPDGSINATTVDLDPATAGIQSTRTTTEGSYAVNSVGLVTFTPLANYHGTSSITYTVNDNVGATSNVATITVTVNSVNDLPVANNDAASTMEGAPVTINVVANDTDVDGTIDPTSVDLNVTSPGIQNTNTTTAGTFTVNASGVVTFTPTGTFSGTATLGYRVNDNSSGTSNTATISITVTAVNDPPVASNDATTTNEDVAVTLNVVANDTDEDGTISASTVDLNPAVPGPNNSITTGQGTFTVNASGVVTYTPTPNFNGTATITYTVNDNGGLTSNEATITITVNAVNDPPQAVNDALSSAEDTPATINIISNDTDIDGTIDLATIDLNTGVAGIQNSHTVPGGSFVANTTTGEVTFTPTPNYSGTFNLPYRVSDNLGAVSNQALIAVTVTEVNDKPVFSPIDTVKVYKNSGVKTVTVTGISPGPSESEQMLLTATSGNTSLVPNPTVTYNGTATSATLSFTPVAGKFGTAEITVKLVDTGLNEYTQVFIVEVIEVKIGSTPPLVATVGSPYSYSVAIQVNPEIEKNNVPYEVSVLTKPAWLTLTGSPKVKTLSGIPPSNAAASNTVRLQVKVGAFLLDEQIYTLNINKAPDITDFAVTATEDVPRPFTQQEFQNAYTDGNGDALNKIIITTLPSRGHLKLNGNLVAVDQEISLASIPALVYLSDLDSSGADAFKWKASDGFTISAEANVTVNVSSVNDGPRIVNLETDSLAYEVGTNIPLPLTEIFDAHDPDDKILAGAQVGFRSINYRPSNDQLIFVNTAKVSGDFDNQSGILTLTGSATVEEYEDAIRSIRYNFIASEIVIEDKWVYFTLTDGKTQGETKERKISLGSTFEDPDIPNVFTPDGNGVNDFWLINNGDNAVDRFARAEIRVYNRRGMLVYETIGFENPWDGTLGGTVLPADTYFYTIDVKRNNKIYKGSVTIIR